DSSRICFRASAEDVPTVVLSGFGILRRLLRSTEESLLDLHGYRRGLNQATHNESEQGRSYAEVDYVERQIEHTERRQGECNEVDGKPGDTAEDRTELADSPEEK